MVKCYSISARFYRPMKLLPHIGSKIEAFAGHRTSSIRATNDAGSYGSIDSPLMQSIEKKIEEQLNADTVVVKMLMVMVGMSEDGLRQRMVYKAIWEERQNTVHAVDQMTTKTPTEAAAGK